MTRELNPYAPGKAAAEVQTNARLAAAGTRQVVWVIWLTYGAFYFCRTNISAAVPGLEMSIDQGGLGLEKTQIGLVLGSLKIGYALGQLVNGQLSEHFSPRRLLAIGMLCSAALNICFGFGTAFYFLLFVWTMNGYCQSLGWAPCVRVVANWVPVARRGVAIGIIGTGYQITLGMTFIVAGWSAQLLGWRGALFVPSGLLVAGALVMLLLLKEQPDENLRDDAQKRSSDADSQEASLAGSTLLRTFWLTLSNPALWLLGVSLGFLNACRYGFLDWGLAHLKEVQETDVARAAMKYALLPVGAIAGSYLSGWATDRLFGSRRAPVICILLVLLGILTLAYDTVSRTSVAGTLVLLVAIGFCIYGPQVLLVGTAPADLACRGTSAAAAGFVNFIGYVGAALAGDLLTGYLLKNYSWRVVIYFWAAWAFVAAGLVAVLWNATPRETERA